MMTGMITVEAVAEEAIPDTMGQEALKSGGNEAGLQVPCNGFGRTGHDVT